MTGRLARGMRRSLEVRAGSVMASFRFRFLRVAGVIIMGDVDSAPGLSEGVLSMGW